MSKSPNVMSRYGWSPDMIVMHVCEGSFAGSVSWLCNPISQASSHYVTGKNGELSQLVDLPMAAWCNGTSTVPTSGGFYGNSTNELVRTRATNANYYTISIENEGYSYKDLKGGLTEAQYITLLNLCKELITKYPAITIDRQHIIGHYEIAPSAKPNCPGINFPWDRLINDLKAWKGVVPNPIVPTPVDTKYRVGDTVSYSSCYISSTANPNQIIKLSRIATGKITRVLAGKNNPYLINNGTCWINDNDVKSNQPQPAPSASFRVGQVVTLQNYATNYATGQGIPVSIRNKKYTIMQVGNGKVLLKEIMSWVLNQDVK
jgi:hypothetical protein